MLKITVHDAADGLRLKLEGKLAGAWVSELEHCWHTAKASHPNTAFLVDLRGVTFIDHAGRYLLQLMNRDGASFVACRLMIQDLLDEGAGSAEGGTC